MAAIGILGGGSFGTALAHVLANAGHRVTMVLRNAETADAINSCHQNSRYLPGININPAVFATTEARALQGADCWVLALPCQQQKVTLPQYLPWFSEKTILVNVAKGIVLDGAVPLSSVVPPIFGLHRDSPRYAVLSGPSFAREAAENKPTAVVLGCTDASQGTQLREIFSSSTFRCYSSTDILGVELGGAVKNIIAIAAGICDGLQFGHNSRAALVTRGLAEISRFGVVLGAQASTFMGLSGLGDLMLTCTGDLSRNRQVGLRLGKGETLPEILGSMKTVAEGVPTTHAVAELSRELGVEMPITRVMNHILNGEISPLEGVSQLMNRNLKAEEL